MKKNLEQHNFLRVFILGKQFNEITTLSKDLIAKLESEYIAQPLTMVEKNVSNDETIKFLFKLCDNQLIESVLMKYKYGYSLCVSSQVGCRMNCSFCASGKGGFVRNLTAGEILAQVIFANNFLEGGLKDKRKVINIVLMGSGEPLDNFENVKKFVELLTFEKGLMFSLRNIALSTCGIVPKIKQLADEKIFVMLTISLHATTDEKRQELMPIAKVYSIKQIIDACKYFFNKSGRRIMFEYVIVKGKNDKEKDAENLAMLLRGFPAHVNIIALNNTDDELERKYASDFMEKLIKRNVSATVRRTLGQDIEGACGQLKERFLKGE